MNLGWTDLAGRAWSTRSDLKQIWVLAGRVRFGPDLGELEVVNDEEHLRSDYEGKATDGGDRKTKQADQRWGEVAGRQSKWTSSGDERRQQRRSVKDEGRKANDRRSEKLMRRKQMVTRQLEATMVGGRVRSVDLWQSAQKQWHPTKNSNGGKSKVTGRGCSRVVGNQWLAKQEPKAAVNDRLQRS